MVINWSSIIYKNSTTKAYLLLIIEIDLLPIIEIDQQIIMIDLLIICEGHSKSSKTNSKKKL